MNKKFFLFQQRVGDFEVSEEVFNNLLSFIDLKYRKRHWQVVTMISDDEPLITYFYLWSKSSDFTYLGYTTEEK